MKDTLLATRTVRLIGLAIIAWVAVLAGVMAGTDTAQASHAYTEADEPVGNRSVGVNWAYCSGSTACWKTDVLDWTEDSRMTDAKSTSYYVEEWNGYLDAELYVIKDVYPLPYGTPVVIGTMPSGESSWPTHIHMYTNDDNPGTCSSGASETNGSDWVDCSIVHVSEGTLDSGDNSLATVMSHEVGHSLFLKDHSGTGSGTIMHSPNPGIMTPTYSDKRTAAECRYVSWC